MLDFSGLALVKSCAPTARGSSASGVRRCRAPSGRGSSGAVRNERQETRQPADNGFLAAGGHLAHVVHAAAVQGKADLLAVLAQAAVVLFVARPPDSGERVLGTRAADKVDSHCAPVPFAGRQLERFACVDTKERVHQSTGEQCPIIERHSLCAVRILLTSGRLLQEKSEKAE